MTGKIKLYIGLLALGVVVIGGGIWLLYNAVPKLDTHGAPAISEKTSYSYLIPESMPLITENISYIMRGEFNFLSIYEDGTVIYIEEKGLRMPSPEHPPTRNWRTGQLQPEELNGLLEFIKSSGFEELNDAYKFAGNPIEGGGFAMGDMSCVIYVGYGNLSKKVSALGYLSPDQGLTYPDMPYPLNEIYKRLKDIADNRTKEVARETIKY